ncbi:MAG: flagellar basal body-associated FliL family protein [Thermodesulfobacteriota bacterium]|nr:flagellar basal body-associated FliL family protein [Thermodesulfobacteriota bacterium]
MAEEDKDLNEPDFGQDEAEQLEDLDLGEVDSLQDTDTEAGRSLPKKVELDIDDMDFGVEEDKEEEPEEPEEEPKETPEQPEPEENEAKASPQYSSYKVAFLAGVALTILAVAAGLLIFFMPSPQQPVAVDEHLKIELQPFIINFPAPDEDVIIKLTLSLSFPSAGAMDEFTGRRTALRDLVFRFIQGQGPVNSDNPEVKAKLRKGLIGLINESLEKGGVKQLKIVDLIIA